MRGTSSNHATRHDVDACQAREAGDVHVAGAEMIGEAAHGPLDHRHFRGRSRVVRKATDSNVDAQACVARAAVRLSTVYT